MSLNVLITRPKEKALILSEQLKLDGFQTIVEPVLRLSFIEYNLPGLQPYDAFIFTSTYAVEAFDISLIKPECVVFCVGHNTMKSLQEKKCSCPIIVAENSQKLVSKIIDNENYRSKHFFYIRGEFVSLDLRIFLKSKGVNIGDLVVYSMQEIPNFSDELRQSLIDRSVDIIPFFSSRTAEVFVGNAQKANLSRYLSKISVLCFSRSMLDCLKSVQWKNVQACENSNFQSMYDLILSQK